MPQDIFLRLYDIVQGATYRPAHKPRSTISPACSATSGDMIELSLCVSIEFLSAQIRQLDALVSWLCEHIVVNAELLRRERNRMFVPLLPMDTRSLPETCCPQRENSDHRCNDNDRDYYTFLFLDRISFSGPSRTRLR